MSYSDAVKGKGKAVSVVKAPEKPGKAVPSSGEALGTSGKPVSAAAVKPKAGKTMVKPGKAVPSSGKALETSGNPVSTAATHSGMASVPAQTVGQTVKSSKVRLIICFIDSS